LQEALIGALGQVQIDNPDVVIMPHAGLTFSE
jgi:hypothetical protein